MRLTLPYLTGCQAIRSAIWWPAGTLYELRLTRWHNAPKKRGFFFRSADRWHSRALTVVGHIGNSTDTPAHIRQIYEGPKHGFETNLGHLDTVGTVYHLVIYICSPTRYTKSFNDWVFSSLMLARHVSDLTGPSSGAFCTSCIRRLWYVVLLCVLLDTLSRYIPKSANTACTKRSWWWTGEVRNMSS